MSALDVTTFTLQAAVDCTPFLSVTVSWNVNAPCLEGALKLSLLEEVLDSLTDVPPVWVHLYDAIPGPPVSVEFKAYRVTEVEGVTI
jgi:hypothetical protein